MHLHRWLLRPLFTISALLAFSACAADLHADSYRITCQPTASSFLIAESVEFTVSSTLPTREVQWSIIDFGGEQRAGGTLRVGAGSPATLRVRPGPGVGYYRLRLGPPDGSPVTKVFTVLPPPDEARGDGGLFGITGHFRGADEWEMAARMGTRHVRAEFAWPGIEREKGQYDFTTVDRFAQAARQRNMQLTVLAGHTPRHYGVRPADAEGRVADAWYTWQPEGTVEWYRFIDTLSHRLVPKRLAPEEAHPADTLPRSPRPFVRLWEVWSEADQNFYYGSWDRYLDMLRIAWATVRSHGRVPMVYGSCGHMTEMVYTFRAGCGDYFDRVAYHPWGDDPDHELMHWFRNMPQQMLRLGVPPETAFTECDFFAGNVEDEPGFILRLYATLKSWRLRDYIRSGCTGGVFTGANRPHTLVRYVNDEWVPRPAYVAFALTRWLLDSAHYIGPLEAPEGARLKLFMREGVPMVVGWAEEGSREIALPVAARAVLIDAVGARRSLHGPRRRLSLRPTQWLCSARVPR